MIPHWGSRIDNHKRNDRANTVSCVYDQKYKTKNTYNQIVNLPLAQISSKMMRLPTLLRNGSLCSKKMIQLHYCPVAAYAAKNMRQLHYCHMAAYAGTKQI